MLKILAFPQAAVISSVAFTCISECMCGSNSETGVGDIGYIG